MAVVCICQNVSKTPVRCRGCAWRLSGSAGVAGTDEAERAERGVELLQTGIEFVARSGRAPGDLDGVLLLEDVEHRFVLGARALAVRLN